MRKYLAFAMALILIGCHSNNGFDSIEQESEFSFRIRHDVEKLVGFKSSISIDVKVTNRHISCGWGTYRPGGNNIAVDERWFVWDRGKISLFPAKSSLLQAALDECQRRWQADAKKLNLKARGSSY